LKVILLALSVTRPGLGLELLLAAVSPLAGNLILDTTKLEPCSRFEKHYVHSHFPNLIHAPFEMDIGDGPSHLIATFQTGESYIMSSNHGLRCLTPYRLLTAALGYVLPFRQLDILTRQDYRSLIIVLNHVDGFRREFDLNDPRYVHAI
jgi:hypothetical protein